ncbi:DUF4188 domain-containing protein [Halalkalibacter sp. APA_J-10(15)]|uniref:DUF4188 domain-containing protein n=1 Tax=unclassified Halalkalibacter TaxID=2893063 RepID=UPI001FF62740|nr:DUF4188 domain-containing protein [Halalkalibacter sp. APA_J-10(15)]MCK0471820.1 DUF4188 domain-containing protein [Halalkalibacter sp. APA_J-10(15)]
MGKSIYPGRFTADNQEDIVVFMIGMRVNQWWAVHKWLPVFVAMPPMMRELATNKELGCLSMESFTGLRTTYLLQYWRSEKDLFTYARGDLHLPAWKSFNKRARNNSAVGFYHETYVVPKGSSESIYVNMPKFGLANATAHISVDSKLDTAEQRLRR